MAERAVYLPKQFLLDAKVHRSTIRQLLTTEQKLVLHVDGAEPIIEAVAVGKIIKAVKNARSLPVQADRVLQTMSGSLPASLDASKREKAKWILPVVEQFTAQVNPVAVKDSWRGQFFFIEEEMEGGNIIQNGLRPPQTGALHAALAHWKVSEQLATIVMPTGTGKTETMLALLIQQRLPRLLVIVPNLALRAQIEGKFLTLGLLKKLGVVGDAASLPIVTCLLKQLASAEQMEAVVSPANVVITNIQVLQGCSDEALRALEGQISHLFVDEAHHMPASTWTYVGDTFSQKPILQFTATPFRNDGKLIEGTVIFNYPLKKAQKEQYFRPVTFDPVTEWDD